MIRALLGTVLVLALTGCGSLPDGPLPIAQGTGERARNTVDIWVFSDSPEVAQRVGTALAKLGYTRVYTNAETNADLNIKWGTAPRWMPTEVVMAAATVLGENPASFRQVEDASFKDSIALNVPTLKYRSAAAAPEHETTATRVKGESKIAGFEKAAPEHETTVTRVAETTVKPTKASAAPASPAVNKKVVNRRGPGPIHAVAPAGKAPPSPPTTTTTGPFKNYNDE